MDPRKVADSVSHQLRDLLIEHVDGGTYVEAPFIAVNKYRRRSMLVLMERGLIRFSGYKRQQTTRITENGRRVLAYVLADYAEALIRAGAMPPSQVIEAPGIYASERKSETRVPLQPQRIEPLPLDSGLAVAAK